MCSRDVFLVIECAQLDFTTADSYCGTLEEQCSSNVFVAAEHPGLGFKCDCSYGTLVEHYL